MSIARNISSLPDTKRTFGVAGNTLAQIRGIFLAKKTFTFSSVDDFKDIDSWHTALENEDITPVHYVKEFDVLDDETIIGESQQDFSYKLRSGKYRHKLSYDFSLDLHQVLETISESDLYVFYWDKNLNIYGTSDDGTTVRGFKTNRIILEKILFQVGSNPGFSVLDIELRDSDEINENGVVEKVEWYPSDVDRLFITIDIQYLDSQTLNFTASYMGTPIGSGIEASNVTITDNVNGDILFSLFDINGGVYKLSGFSNNITNGLLQILAPLYLGCSKYFVRISVPIESTFLLLDDDDFALLDDDGFNLLLNVIEIAVFNSGYSPANDWINPVAGLADGWQDISSLSRTTFSIVTGNGFTGNAQRMVVDTIDDNMIIKNTSSTRLTIGKTYTVKFEYRSTNSIFVAIDFLSPPSVGSSFPANTGNATEESFSFVATQEIAYVRVAAIAYLVGEFVEIDKIRYEEEL